MNVLTRLKLVILLLFTPAAIAQTNPAVSEILSSKMPPTGVVFEIMEWQNDTFSTLLKDIEDYSAQLKSRHPNIDVAVVSHGSEQFTLLDENASTHTNIHDLTKSLVNSGISVEVCATHASWNGNTPEDFAEHIGVVERAPIAIQQYQDQGYTLIRL
ncbi:DsrE family protein [Vibrio makurazakiensis]|uniref:DsrE family protein n=1 Tax=Vibrio makurazakiensis TaxID=2910250 RepID=UPI003D102C9F